MRLRMLGLALAAFLVAGAVAPASPQPQWTPLIAPAEAGPATSFTPQQWAASDDPPSPGLQGGIGPGSALRQSTGGSGFICTAAFLLRDPYTGTYYLSTAGHCLVRDDAATGPLTGAANAEQLHSKFSICVADCVNNALGLGTYVDLVARDGDHPVAYARANGVGADFGILRLPGDLHGDLRPDLPLWHGPDGMASSVGASEPVVLYGHGSLCCPNAGAVLTRTPADQGRAGSAIGSAAASFEALGWTSGGDSGSGVSVGTLSGDTLTGGQALGVLTHGSYIANPAASVPIFTGTMLEHGLAMVRSHTGLQLELVQAGDPLPREPTATPQPAANLTVLSPTDGATLDLGSKKATVQGTAGLPDGSLPVGHSVQVAIDDPAFGSASRLPVQGNTSWKATWDFAGVAAGHHVVRARIVDADGNTVDQSNVTVTLQKGASTSASGTGASSSPRGGTDTTSGRGAGGNGGAFAGDAAKAPKAVGAPGPSLVLAGLAVASAAIAARRRA